MATIADVRLQMRLLGYSGISLRRGEVRELPQLLRPDEQIQQAVYGSYDGGFGMLVATDQRLLFVDRRFFHRHYLDIAYDGINSVELDTGLFTGSVTVHSKAGDITLRGMSPVKAKRFYNYIDSCIEQASDNYQGLSVA